MYKYLRKQQTLFFILVSSILLIAGYLFWPTNLNSINLFVFLLSIGTATFFIYRKHQESYHQAESTREKMIRNLILDMLGFLLTMGAAMYMGGIAGRYLGLRAGLWIGLLAGFAGGFLAAWAVRSVWGKLVLARI